MCDVSKRGLDRAGNAWRVTRDMPGPMIDRYLRFGDNTTSPCRSFAACLCWRWGWSSARRSATSSSITMIAAYVYRNTNVLAG